MNHIILSNTEEARRVISEADDLLSNLLYFNNEWDMEACFTPYRVDWKEWNHSPNKDAEWVYMLNRLEFLTKLLLADYLTGDHKYLDKWLDIVHDWQLYGKSTHKDIKKPQLLQKIVSFLDGYINLGNIQSYNFSGYRPLDVALRCISLLEGVSYIDDSGYIDKKITINIRSDVDNEINYIIEHWESWYEHSNWGLIIASSVLYCGLFLDNRNYVSWAELKIPTMVSLQYDSDGIQFEGSPMYAVQVAILFAKIKSNFLGKLNENIEGIITSVCQSTFNYLVAIKAPDEKLPPLGDSDSTPLASILNIFSCLLFNETNDIQNLNYVTLFPFRHILEKSTTGKIIENKPFVSFDSGISVMRNDDNDYLLVTNGKCYSGHRHMDNGNFILYKSSHKVFIDPGRYTYKKSYERTFLRSEVAHNTILIDGHGFTKCKNVWDVHKYPIWHNNDVRILNGTNIVLLSARYIGEIKKRCAFIERFFILTDSNDILIVSHVYCPGAHKCSELFHLASNCSIKDDGAFYTLQTDGEECFFSFEKSWHTSFKKSICSDNYGELNRNTTMVTRKEFKDHYISVFCVSDRKINTVLETLNSLCGAFKISAENGMIYKLKYNFHSTGIKPRINIDGDKQIDDLVLEYNLLNNSDANSVIIK